MKKNMMRTLKTITILSLAAALLLGGSVSAFAANKVSTKTQAKKVALKKANVKSSSVKKWTKVKLDNWDSDRDKEWEVEFRTGTYKYEVEINARTGRIEDYEKEKIKTAKSSKSQISKSEAKSIALKKAKITSKSVTKWTKIKLDGNEWELKFQTKTYKYEVEINARTGKVKDFEKKKIAKSSASAKYIGTDAAKSIALSHAKKQEDITGNVYYTKAKLDREDGIWVYEVEFRNGWYEFEYEIDAKTGEILDWDIDYDD